MKEWLLMELAYAAVGLVFVLGWLTLSGLKL